jgi:hypothetical protein
VSTFAAHADIVRARIHSGIRMAILLKIRKSDTNEVLLFGELKIQFKLRGNSRGNRYFE